MRRFEDVERDFASDFEEFAKRFPKPAKKYIAYNAGQSLVTNHRSEALAFSPKKLIEIIDPDPIVDKQWRDEKHRLDALVQDKWEKELFAEGGLNDAQSERILRYLQECDSDKEWQANNFIELAAVVDACIGLQ